VRGARTKGGGREDLLKKIQPPGVYYKKRGKLGKGIV